MYWTPQQEIPHSMLPSAIRIPRGLSPVSELPADREVIVHCVCGHEVGRATAMRLRAAGLNARYLRGGIVVWRAAGQTLNPKGATP
jgi:Fe-Mn family superoxide dismutase